MFSVRSSPHPKIGAQKLFTIAQLRKTMQKFFSNFAVVIAGVSFTEEKWKNKIYQRRSWKHELWAIKKREKKQNIKYFPITFHFILVHHNMKQTVFQLIGHYQSAVLQTWQSCQLDSLKLKTSNIVQYVYTLLTLTIYEKNHSSFLCCVICIWNKTIHLKYWSRRIVIRNSYLHQITSNRNAIYGFDGIKLWQSSNSVNICSINTMLYK